MDRTEAKRIIEALLFATDIPLPVSKIKSTLGEIDIKILRQLLHELKDEYERDGHSFSLVELAGGFQIYTRPEYSKWVGELFRGRRVSRLTAASLETLGIVAYKQPIIKADMESIRGVNVDGVTATLLERNLITAVGHDNRPGKPVLFGTTPEFLRYFGLTSLSDLPRIEELEEYLKSKQAEKEKMDAEIDAELGLKRLSGYGTQEEVPFESPAVISEEEPGGSQPEAVNEESPAQEPEAGPAEDGEEK